MRAIAAGEELPVKFRLYSAHDENIANWLVQLNPGFNWLGIQFASQIKIEVYQVRNEDQFFVQMLYNGAPLRLEMCWSTLCSMEEFFDQMDKFSLPSSEIEAACTAPDDPFPRIRSSF